MKRFLLLVSILVMLAGLNVLPAMAQAGTVKGSAKDQDGKAITDGTVELDNVDTGKKMTSKTARRSISWKRNGRRCWLRVDRR